MWKQEICSRRSSFWRLLGHCRSTVVGYKSISVPNPDLSDTFHPVCLPSQKAARSEVHHHDYLDCIHSNFNYNGTARPSRMNEYHIYEYIIYTSQRSKLLSSKEIFMSDRYRKCLPASLTFSLWLKVSFNFSLG